VQEIDAVCFVIRAPQARLTPTQKYIFAQVLGIFGNDIKDNILILMTFADGKKPQALVALREGKVPFKDHFKLNNSAFDLPEDDGDEEDIFSKLFWDVGMSSFDKLFKAIDTLETKSLQLTKKVLTRREELENYVTNIQPTIRAGFTVYDKLRQQIVLVQKYGDMLNANEDFEYKVKENKARQQPNEDPNLNTTTCMTCNYTCHENCGLRDDGDKARCVAMDGGGNCTICPSNCHWTIHKNMPYTVIWYEEEVTKTADGLKQKYLDAQSDLSASEQIMVATVSELSEVEENLNALINSVRNCLNELNKIALRPNTLSQDDYIDKLIASEEQEKILGLKIGLLP